MAHVRIRLGGLGADSVPARRRGSPHSTEREHGSLPKF